MVDTEFLNLLTPVEALHRFFDHVQARALGEESVLTACALGRVTAKPVIAPEPLPPFTRSTVDGYAVRAADTYGASDSLPAYLKLSGEVPMGSAPNFELKPQTCALIHTGGMLPPGSNAVAMIETTQRLHTGDIEVFRAVADGENIIKMGEDVAVGEEVIPVGVRLRPAEIGGLMALGITALPVACKPRIGILSSGDEVVPPEAKPNFGQVRDINAYTLSALVEGAGGVPARYGVVADDSKILAETARRALSECDALVLTAGSSVSVRDLTSTVIDSLGRPGILVHGINIRPGKPTILAVCDGKPVVGLPGNPVSALVIAWLYVIPLVERMLGIEKALPPGSVSARLTTNIPSQAGREDWVPVRLSDLPEGRLAEPVFSKSGLIFWLVRTDGLVQIPADATGLSAGEQVSVTLLR